ncbi:MAG: AmmeMemoRadiSam system radical SAM enzyme [Myxococcus sp.]|nr:AmmeMemoRadiSam system radical SAM enzyme [Myxococcus sp.]
MKGPIVPGRWWHRLDDGRVQCDLCPRDCKLHEGQRGFCFVRARENDQVMLTTYGRSSGFCVDPIEKKPLNHFFPGTSVLSFGTAGCNLGCRFCQNWDISKARELDRLQDEASPEAIAARARQLGAKSVAFTYNDPTIFAEYAMDVADACHALDVRTVAVTAGYIHDAPRRALYEKIDAANVDLKAFTEDFYEKQTLSHLAPVLETIEYLVKETKVWVELTTLLIPSLNDSEKEIAELSEWVMGHLGPDVPLHFSAFHPDFKLTNLPATPPETLQRARRQAMQAGLRYVYTGNVHDPEGDTTLCPACRAPVIERDWYQLNAWRLGPGGACTCGNTIAGHFDARPGDFGRRRLPIQMRVR